MATLSTSNYTIGGAHLYFSSTIAHTDLFNATAFETTDHNLGNIVVAEISPDITYIEHWISLNGKRVRDKTISNVISVSIPFTFDEMNEANLEKYFQGTAAASRIPIMQTLLDEGSAQLVVKTSIGQDLKYSIPKCVLKPNGALAMADEDWHQAPMVLEVLQFITGDSDSATINASWVANPYGMVCTSDM